jgi:predicted NUDIX family NTP pyrophosphohydrolase
MAKRSAGLLVFRVVADVVEVFLVHPGGPLWTKKDKGSWTIPKGKIKQKSGKVVSTWAIQGDCDTAKLTSNTCVLEWPPRSGVQIEIPEVDRGQWFTLDKARKYIREEQEDAGQAVCRRFLPVELDRFLRFILAASGQWWMQ